MDGALQAAREEAAGAGVGRFTLYATTTVTDDTELGAAVADVEQRACQARLRLRRLRGAQAAGFAAALGVGVDPDDSRLSGTQIGVRMISQLMQTSTGKPLRG